jgi:hypothetical protein
MMQMKKMVTFCFAVLFFLSLPNYSFPQPQDWSFSNGLKIKPGAHFEYFSRMMTWDDDQHTSELKSYIFALNIEFEINEGFSISALAGYTLSNYDSLVFRQLPFSVELDVGDVGGYIIGAEARKSLLNTDAIEFGLYGQFLYHIGKEKKWDIPGLSVSGTLTGKPTWMRAAVGPYFSLTNLGAFAPYLSVRYNKLWGKFEIKQAIQTLKGTEEKDLQSKSVIDVTLGSILTLTDNFFFKGEVHILPHSDGMDLGFVAIAAFSF